MFSFSSLRRGRLLTELEALGRVSWKEIKETEAFIIIIQLNSPIGVLGILGFGRRWIEDTGEGTYQWVVLGSRATATASQFGGTVFAGGTVAGVIPSEDFIGFSYTNLNPARYANTGNSYVFSGYLRGNSGTYDGSIQLLDSAGDVIAFSAVSTASAGSAAWTRIGGVLTNSSTSIVAGVGFSFGITQATATTGTTMRGEGFLVEPGTAFTNYLMAGIRLQCPLLALCMRWRGLAIHTLQCQGY